MAVKIPSYQNTQTASLGRSSAGQVASTPKAPSMQNALGNVGKALEIANVIRNERDDAEATTIFNEWSEQVEQERDRLMLQTGLEAEDLSNKLTQFSEELVSGYEFGNSRVSRKFDEMTKPTLSSTRTALNKHEMSQAVITNNQQNKVAMLNARDRAIQAISSGNIEEVDSSFVDYVEAHKKSNKGLPEDVRVRAVTDAFSSDVRNQLLLQGNSNPTSAVVNAAKMKDRGMLSEVDYQSVIAQNKSGYVKELATQHMESILEAPENKFKTLKELTGDENAPDATTTEMLPYDERMSRAYAKVQEGLNLDDPVYGDISKDVNGLAMKAFNEFKERQDVRYEQNINALKEAVLNADADNDLGTDETTYQANQEKKANAIANLREMGEHSLASELQDTMFKTGYSEDGVFGEASLMIETGEVTRESDLLRYKNKLNAADYKSLVNMMRGQNSSRFKSDMAGARKQLQDISVYKRMDEHEKAVTDDKFIKSFQYEYARLQKASPNGVVPKELVSEAVGVAMSNALGTGRQRGKVEIAVDEAIDIRKEALDIGMFRSIGSANRRVVERDIDIARSNLIMRKGIDFTKDELIEEYKSVSGINNLPPKMTEVPSSAPSDFKRSLMQGDVLGLFKRLDE